MILNFFLTLIITYSAVGFSIFKSATLSTTMSPTSTTEKPRCTLNFTALNKENILNWPLFTVNSQFIYAPPNKDTIEIPTGQDVEITCPGGKTKGIKKAESVKATCISGSKFKIAGVTYDFATIKLSCTVTPVHNARYTSPSEPCGNNGKEVKIGFTQAGKYIQQILLCFDLKTQLALYAHYTLTNSIGQHEEYERSDEFVPDPFYTIGNEHINDLYSVDHYKPKINSKLGLPDISDKYIKYNNLLSRGHYAAMGEFVYRSQQDATFHFVNVAPQWEFVNKGNWENIETKLINCAKNLKTGVEVYTGTWGVTSLPHEKNITNFIPLYLYEDGIQTALPVPDLYWKAVYYAEKKQAVVIFTVNNPYKQLELIKAESILCKNDVLKDIEWLKLKKPKDIELGYTYACEFAAAKAKINYLPDWTVTGLFQNKCS